MSNADVILEKTSISDIIARSVAELTEQLVNECEQLVDSREEHLRQECRLLREENYVLKKRLHKSTTQPATQCLEGELPTEESVDLEVNMGVKTTDGVVSRPHFKPWPEYLKHPTIGNLEVREDYWSNKRARPAEDHGFCDTGSRHHLEENEKSHFFIIDPTSHLKLGWDMIGIPVLGWDLITIPMQVFDIGETTLMVTMSWVTMIYWTCDMPVTFVTGYCDRDSNLVMDLWMIVRRYLAGFFWLDLIIVSSDWIGVIMSLASSGDSAVLENMGALRALRASRFIRLMRLRKLKAKWQTIEDNIDSEWSLVCLNLIGKVVGIMALNHYVGCCFYWLGKLDVHGYQTWLSHPYPQFGSTSTIESAPWGYLYITAVHWAITQFTPGSMHIQAQNIPERVFAVFCLLFGLIVFSSFIASVTQARLQLNKMMSKFEKDLWILRKYCRQNGVSTSLKIRMKRYVDMVLVPRYRLMAAQDVVILPQLSQHLRDELFTELVSQHLNFHSFFKELTSNKAVITHICISAVQTITCARGDVIFSAGQVGSCMYMVTDGVLEYLPHEDASHIQECRRGSVISEAVLWTPWTQQGQLQSSVETRCIVIESSKFRSVLVANAITMAFTQRYAHAFIANMNKDVERSAGGIPSDLQHDIARQINVKELKHWRQNGSEWQQATSSSATSKSTPRVAPQDLPMSGNQSAERRNFSI